MPSCLPLPTSLRLLLFSSDCGKNCQWTLGLWTNQGGKNGRTEHSGVETKTHESASAGLHHLSMIEVLIMWSWASALHGRVFCIIMKIVLPEERGRVFLPCKWAQEKQRKPMVTSQAGSVKQQSHEGCSMANLRNQLYCRCDNSASHSNKRRVLKQFSLRDPLSYTVTDFPKYLPVVCRENAQW